jgi:hypothetical protein
MESGAGFTAGLEAFAQQFRAQLAKAGVPTSEHAVHFCLALGFQAAYDLAPGAVVFERPTGSGRLDLWFIPCDLIVEVTFRRGQKRPTTQLFGSLLADFGKVARFPAERRMVLYVSDRLGVRYVEGSARGILPLTLESTVSISPECISSLRPNAANRTLAQGPWPPLRTELVWREQIDEWSLLAWEIHTEQ